ncbi:uncharacterized protein [Lolium perenne]|uniref:uncharacterized protein n=1 Tax=Lolium perenne TaxID=4522 RepID=UPI003A98D1F6
MELSGAGGAGAGAEASEAPFLGALGRALVLAPLVVAPTARVVPRHFDLAARPNLPQIPQNLHSTAARALAVVHAVEHHDVAAVEHHAVELRAVAVAIVRALAVVHAVEHRAVELLSLSARAGSDIELWRTAPSSEMRRGKKRCRN